MRLVLAPFALERFSQIDVDGKRNDKSLEIDCRKQSGTSAAEKSTRVKQGAMVQ
jgi:hypothetical protein